MSVRNLVPWLLYCLFGLAAAQSACGPYRVAFYDLGLLHYRDASGMARGIDVDLIELLSFRTRQQRAIAQRVQVAILVDPLLLVDEDPMHQRDLARRPAKAEATDLE